MTTSARQPSRPASRGGHVEQSLKITTRRLPLAARSSGQSLVLARHTAMGNSPDGLVLLEQDQGRRSTLRFRPACNRAWFESHAARITWQIAGPQAQFLLGSRRRSYAGPGHGRGLGVGLAPEGTLAYHFRPTGFHQVSWSAPVTSRLLIDGAFSANINHWPQFRSPGVLPDHISILEQSTGVRYNSRETYDDPNIQNRFGERFSCRSHRVHALSSASRTTGILKASARARRATSAHLQQWRARELTQ